MFYSGRKFFHITRILPCVVNSYVQMSLDPQCMLHFFCMKDVHFTLLYTGVRC